MVSLSQTFDTTRVEIIAAMQARIGRGDRTKLTKQELDELIAILVAQLEEMNALGTDTKAAVEQLCAAEQALLERAYPPSSINSVYFPRYTKAIKAAIEAGRITLNGKNSYPRRWMKRNPLPGEPSSGSEARHYALDGFTYPIEVQAQLRAVTTKHANARQDSRVPIELDDYMAQVQELLASNDAIDLIIAIAAVTGRRHTEVVSLGQLSPMVDELTQLIPQAHPFMLRFEGHQKSLKRAYEILSLVPATDVLLAVEKLRACAEVLDLAGVGSEDSRMEALNARVNRRVVAALGEVLKPPVGFSQISIHRCRAAYLPIALHFFCPPNMAEQRLAQHLLGHVLLDEEAVGNAAVTGHYYQYFLTRDDKPIQARGVKLAAAGPIPLPPDDLDTDGGALMATTKATKTKAQLTQVVDGTGADVAAETVASLAATIATQALTVQEQALTIDRLSQRPLTTGVDSAEVERLQEENARLQAVNQRLRDQLEQLRAIAQRKDQFQAAQLFFQFDFSVEEEVREQGDQDGQLAGAGEREGKGEEKTAEPILAGKQLSLAVRRGGRLLELAQAWAKEHPDNSVKMSTSLLKAVGIGTAPTKEIYDRLGENIQAFNDSLGDDSIIAHNRGKTDDFLHFATQILVNENLYNPRNK